STFTHALTQPSTYDPVTPPLLAEPAAIPDMPWKSNPTTSHLKGIVRNLYTGQPVDGALVQLSGSASRTIQTDATGFYAFVDLAPGNYSVSATWSESVDPAPATKLSLSVGEI